MIPIQCMSCSNYLNDNKCKAFKNGIDYDVMIGEIEHTKPLKGQDNNIVFELLK